MNNTFSGKNSMLDYLNPDNNPDIALVELPSNLNPYQDKKVRIFSKMMNTLPLTNVKSLPSFNMLQQAKENGDLEGIDTVIENSSGNTVFSLAVISKLMGIPHTKAVVSNEVSPGKLNMLRLFGTEIIVNKEAICPDPNDKESGIYKAKVWAEENGWFNAGQYDNVNNPEAHKKWTGKQIWEQTGGKLSIFCSGLGTTGTMVGTGSYLKEKNEKINNVGVVRLANNPVPGPRTQNLLREIAFDWDNVVDYVEEVGTIDSFKTSLDLCRSGLVVGPSSGFALKGLYNFLDKQIEDGTLDSFRNEDGEVYAVFISCDTPYPYLNEYFEYLGEENFPKIENRHLLPTSDVKVTKNVRFMDVSKYEISVEEFYKTTFTEEPRVVWEQVNKAELPSINENTVIIDIREKVKYEHFHVPNAINIELDKLEEDIEQISENLKGKKVITVCNRGNSSKISTSILRNYGVEAYSMIGGMTEWSRLDYPRWRPEVCRINY